MVSKKKHDTIHRWGTRNNISRVHRCPNVGHLNKSAPGAPLGTFIYGHSTDQFKILKGCRQGNSIAGYLFVLCIEVLSLTIQNSKTIPYKTKQGNTKLDDTYADDLPPYLKYFSKDEKKKKKKCQKRTRLFYHI